MKKILLVAPMSSVHERFNAVNIEIAKTLQCEIHIVANFELSEHDMEYQKKLNDDGIITHQMQFVRGSLVENIKIIPQMRNLLKNEQFDMAHCHTETGGIITRLSMSANKNTKYVFTPHGMSFYKGSSLKSQLIYYPIEKWICNKMSANIAMNMEELAILKKWNKSTAKFIHGIGLDVENISCMQVNVKEKRKELNIPLDAILILSMGELNENKNHEVILKAISKIKNKNLYYMICGDGEKRDELLTLAKQANLQDRIILTGYRYDVREILKIADIFAFPSFHEGLSVSMMEAMASGLPIVCSKIRGNVDLVKNGEGGFLCEPTDVNSFKNSIEEIINNKELWLSMKNKNLENVNLFSQKTVLSETKEIYRSILEK